MTKGQKWLVGIVGFLVLCAMSCVGILLVAYIATTAHPAVVSTNVPYETPRPTEEVSIPTSTGWVGDQFGPEQAFPAVIVGPAIAEIKGDAGYCALVKVNEGESLNWRGGGAWWQAFSQAALEARFPHHEAEYSAKWPKCKIFLHASDLR